MQKHSRARVKGLGLGLAFEAEFEFETLPPTFSIVADASGGRLSCLLELRITLVRLLAQREYRGSQKKVFRVTAPVFMLCKRTDEHDAKLEETT